MDNSRKVLQAPADSSISGHVYPISESLSFFFCKLSTRFPDFMIANVDIDTLKRAIKAANNYAEGK